MELPFPGVKALGKPGQRRKCDILLRWRQQRWWHTDLFRRLKLPQLCPPRSCLQFSVHPPNPPPRAWSQR